jgi:glutamate/aspartate transport system permease protein
MIVNFDVDVIARSWVYLFQVGMAFTLQLTVMAMTGGVVFGTLLALMRASGMRPLVLFAAAYVNLLRSIPLVLVIFWFYFLVPYLAAWAIGAGEPVKVGPFWSALITFTLFEAAYYGEIMRSGIASVAREQVWAAQALGMDFRQTMHHVVLPQAFRNMIPVLLTQTIVLFQDVSLVYVLSIPDFVGAASKVAQRDGRLVEMYLFVALVYFVLCFALSRLVMRMQQRRSNWQVK